MLDDNTTHYDVLEITPEASTQEIRDAYLRIKSTYHRDQVALYTIFSTKEREEILKKAEEAYVILSDIDKRREYDKSHGLLAWDDNPFHGIQTQTHNSTPTAKPRQEGHLAEVVSIDRVPPMETLPESEEALVSPATDFELTSHRRVPHEFISTQPTQKNDSLPSSASASPNILPYPQKRGGRTPVTGNHSSDMIQAIDAEVEWSGAFIQKVRSSLKLSIEEVSEVTKVSRNYIQAIEEESFAKLPAPVYVRGFVVQIARILRLPVDKVATAYLSRYHRKA